MDLLCCASRNCSEILSICTYNNAVNIQRIREAPMPWIGMYIAAASACCGLAMASDLLKGFKSKSLYFPCKFFSLNAASLTILATAMKLTVDLTTDARDANDNIVRVSSLAMMSIAIGNFMTSVASMNNNEILANVAALFILVTTIAVNFSIYNIQTGKVIYYQLEILGEQICIIIFMFFLIILLCSWATVVSTTKTYLDYKYQEWHKMVSVEREMTTTLEELSLVLKKHWVMAQTGNPQFVMGRSVICAASGFISLLTAFTLVVAYIRLHLQFSGSDLFTPSSSMYKWSINWVLYTQIVGVILGTIAPVMRWFIAVRLKIACIKSFKEEMKVDAYWIQQLVEWRESSIPIRIRHPIYRKVFHVIIRFVLNVCIVIQITTILASKLIMILSVTCAKPAFYLIKKLKKRTPFLRRLESTHLDFSRYVLLLEGEAEMPYMTILSISSEIDKLIQVGKAQQSKNIIQLLQKSGNFNGVREFDNNNVKSLHYQEPPNCWSLPIVTLTSIAISLPDIPELNINQLLSGVGQGLSFVEFIEKTVDTNGNLSNIRNAARGVWVRLELYCNWHDKGSMQETNSSRPGYKQTLQELSDIAQKIVTNFKNDATDFLMNNPFNWPVKVIAANSMYRICQTFLLAEKNSKTNEEMFERLSMIISDILTACFTNLAYVINIKCRNNTIKERTTSIRNAAVFLGESEQVLEIMQKYHHIPGLGPEKAGYIDEWRAYLEQEKGNPSSVPAPGNSQELVSIKLERLPQI